MKTHEQPGPYEGMGTWAKATGAGGWTGKDSRGNIRGNPDWTGGATHWLEAAPPGPGGCDARLANRTTILPSVPLPLFTRMGEFLDISLLLVWDYNCCKSVCTHRCITHHTHTHTHAHTHTDTDTQTHNHTDTQTHTPRTHTHTHYAQAGRQTDINTETRAQKPTQTRARAHASTNG